MALQVIAEPLAQNDVLVVNQHGRKIALFYREFDNQGGRQAAWERAETFIAAFEADLAKSGDPS